MHRFASAFCLGGNILIHLTPRLKAAADLVPVSSVMADIGTDHAYLPLYLVETGKIQRAIASDIHEGPAERARIHIGQEGKSSAIDVRVGSGLLTLIPGEAEGAVIAGMGGLMIQKILEEGADVAQRMAWFVLQPQNHAGDLRMWLFAHNFQIQKEILAREDRMLYQILLVSHGTGEPYKGIEAETGHFEQRKMDPLFPDFLQSLIRKRNFTIEGVPESTDNPVSAEKRARALAEKKELEDMLWKLKSKI